MKKDIQILFYCSISIETVDYRCCFVVDVDEDDKVIDIGHQMP